VATGFADLGGASLLRDGAWRQLTEEDGLAGAKARSVFEDRDGRVWVGSEYDGIAVFDGDRRRVLTPRDGLSGWEVKEMVQDESGVYWLGTEDGLTRIEGIEW
jgi:ligand-binding sensor domain-containing protein